MRALDSGTLYIHFVSPGNQSVDRHACVKRDVDRNVMTGAHTWRCRLRSYERSVGHTISVGRETVSVCIVLGTRGVSGNITRTHHHWENKFVRTVLVLQGLHIADRDLNPFARKSVRDRLRENIRSLLIQQASRLAV